MMTSLENPGGAVSPIPFAEDPEPYDGWSWTFCNLDNGDAFTAASFQKGEMNTEPVIPYGYYLRADEAAGRWNSSYLAGAMSLERFKSFPVKVGQPGSTPTLSLPTRWGYGFVDVVTGEVIEQAAIPWFDDGTFNNQSRQVIAENMADFTSAIGGPGGVGICESVGFEEAASYRQRALQYLYGQGLEPWYYLSGEQSRALPASQGSAPPVP
jgi:hypothetical protein